MHNDVSAFSTDLVRDGPWSGVQCESRVSLRVVYTVASVCICHISIQVQVSMAFGEVVGLEW